MKPSSGLSSQTTQQQAPSHSPEHVDDNPSRRTKSRLTSEKDRAIKQSHKLAVKRDEVKSLPFVFVGNLDNKVTEKQLEELFSSCGKIHRVVIRQTGAWTAKPQEPTLYACVEFRCPSAKVKALKLHGHMLQANRRLIVCLHATELPEFERTVQSSLDSWDLEKAERIKADARRFVRYEPTVLVDEPEESFPSSNTRGKALSRSERIPAKSN
ncbi:hypothetical protein E1B28_004419 [Marasmius oreades]|uniref:RRM domain-containing protein n=1 Tax=Marasmius oreades TaxID=181124 RepID=A0A9P7UYH3_9AGAR|nr:uncharacterized protein E1B28_004419 [Marasmius oreades]KAG7097026.1 hypothetical protein E1B28_004419 [Marasmius oreades]